jgi:hypothetical protein
VQEPPGSPLPFPSKFGLAALVKRCRAAANVRRVFVHPLGQESLSRLDELLDSSSRKQQHLSCQE